MRIILIFEDSIFIDDIDDDMMDGIDSDIENCLEVRNKCFGDYLCKIEVLMEDWRLKYDLDDYDDWDVDDE